MCCMVLQSVAVCCSLSHLRCSVLPCDAAVRYRVLQSAAVSHISCNTLQHTAAHSDVTHLRCPCCWSCATLLQRCFAVCCSVLQCVAVCCSVLQCVAVCCSVFATGGVLCDTLAALYGSVLQCFVAVRLASGWAVCVATRTATHTATTSTPRHARCT